MFESSLQCKELVKHGRRIKKIIRGSQETTIVYREEMMQK